MNTDMITDHRFTAARQLGIGPHPEGTPCSQCGAIKGRHERPTCPGALVIDGEHYACELTVPHDGWSHSNRAAQAVWQ